jgi:hypothetical protein
VNDRLCIVVVQVNQDLLPGENGMRVRIVSKTPNRGSLACDILSPMNPTEYLSREERIRQIGELLAKGATLMLIREAEARRAQEAKRSEQEQAPQLDGDSHDHPESS